MTESMQPMSIDFNPKDVKFFASNFIGTQRKPDIFFEGHPPIEPVYVRVDSPLPRTNARRMTLDQRLPFRYLRKLQAPLPLFIAVLSSE